MSPAKKTTQAEKEEISREERRDQIKALVSGRGEDAANALKDWLTKTRENKQK